MKNQIKLFIALLAFSCFACSQSNLTKRYKSLSMDENPIASKEEASKYVEVTPTLKKIKPYQKKEEKKNVFNLSDRGQAAYFNSLAKLCKDPKDFNVNIGSLIKDREKLEVPLVKKEFVKEIRLDIENNSRNSQSSDRIVNLKLILKLPEESQLEFYEFIDFADKSGVVEFGTLEQERVNNFSLNATAGLTGSATLISAVDNITKEGNNSNSLGLGAEYGISNTTREAVLLKERFIEVAGALNPNEIVIYQEGHWQKDLDGPTSFSVKLKPKSSAVFRLWSFNDLFNEKLEPIKETDVKPRNYFVAVPQIDSKQLVDVYYSFVYSDIVNKKGEKTPLAKDDKVQIKWTKAPIHIGSYEFAAPDNFKVDVLQIQDKNNENALSFSPYGKEALIRFGALKEAEEFLNWLYKSGSYKVGGISLKLGDKNLDASDLQNLEIAPVKLGGGGAEEPVVSASLEE